MWVVAADESARTAAARAIRAASLALQDEAPDLRLSVQQIDALLADFCHDEAEFDVVRAEVEQLKQAMLSRAVIEQAKGILVGAEHCTPDDAFEVLRRASQRENVKLRTIATRIVEKAAGGDGSATSAEGK